MAELTVDHFSPETSKPNPVSLREFSLMNRHEARQFLAPLTKQEKKDFQMVVIMQIQKRPLSEQREIAKLRVDKLSKQENKSLGDKIELLQAKLHLKQVMLPERKPIFLRKLHSKEFPWPKWMKEKKSPYLMAS